MSPSRVVARGSLLALFAFGALTLGACAPTTLAKLSEPCKTDADCGSNVCRDGVCTRTCASQQDCPLGLDCGYAKPEDAEKGGYGPSCYRSTFATAATGGFGTSCGSYSPDPATGKSCVDGAANPCAQGFTCHASARCDASAYCTRACQGDLDCPPSMYCGTENGGLCDTDDDCGRGMKCLAAPGRADKLCQGTPTCLQRTQCSPCATDDQCPAGSLCAVDSQGERYCAKQCSDDDNCPPPWTNGNYFFRCVDAQNGSGKKVCRPGSGSCHGASAIAEQSGKTDTVCSWCRAGFPGDCGEGLFCIQSGGGEAFCTQPCALHIVKKSGAYGFDPSSDPCPEGTYCYIGGPPQDCGSACDAPGVCNANSDYTPETLTCYYE